MNHRINLEESWKKHLAAEFKKDYMVVLRRFLKEEISKGKTIYPHGKDIFSALNCTTFYQTKVVIIGQDPYHGPGQAHGLCFSVKPGVRVPPSLQNIYKELKAELDIAIPNHGHLDHWAKQGVLLINQVLTVEKGKAASHHGKGWEQFTDAIVDKLNTDREKLVFILWGPPAQKKGRHIDAKKHLILKSPHPSPLSAHRGFFGCNHFIETNRYLEKNGQAPIDWSLPPLQ